MPARCPLATFALAAAAAGGAACTTYELSMWDVEQFKVELKEMPVRVQRELDLLFVIDNSGSMGDEQARLATNVPVFINVLEQIEGGLPSLHLAVVSTDLGAGGYHVAVCGEGDDGRFQAAPRAPGCSPPDGAFLRDVKRPDGARERNYEGSLAGAFACIAQLGTTGCGFEQPLGAMRRALERAQTPGDPNHGFLRPHAYLAVVFVTDEDDCSVDDPALFAPSTGPDDPLGPLSAFRCFEHGVVCDGDADPRAPGPRTGCRAREGSPYLASVAEHARFLRSLKDDPRLIMVANLVGNPAPVVVEQDPAQGTPRLAASCALPDGSHAFPGVRLVDFAQRFPDRNTFATICNEDLSDGLRLYAESFPAPIGNPCITGRLVDTDPATPALDPDCVVSDVHDANSADEVETILPRCNAEEDLDPTNAPRSTNLPCWQLARDPTNCSYYPTQLALVVERGGAPVRPGTYVRAQCWTE